MDPFDSAAFAMLERWISRELHGDGGYIRSLYTANDWDTVLRARGIIYAYEEVLKRMLEITRELNEPPRREESPLRPRGLNS